ncbi:ATP-binding protein [Sorangium sp. So ce124]|uniref:ATP-binding protein n=1 Tax=Sorangium sp. So ce124 TaxID=3133280 RepID=UPI003F62C66E
MVGTDSRRPRASGAGSGDRDLAQVPSPESSRVLRRAPAPPAPLVDASRFFGRAQALEELQGYLDDGARLVTILGGPGLGKTRLMRHFGALKQQAGEAVTFCDLTAVTSLDDIFVDVARALDVPLTDGATAEDATAQLGRAIAARSRSFLLLDNLEQVVAHAHAPLSTWLRAAPQTTFLTTSREVLGLEEEVLLELPPLAPEEAVELFLDRARRAAPRVAETERDLVAQLVGQLDCIPLAVELSAGRAGILSVADMLARIQDRFALLRSTRRGAPARHSTLESAIDWSWNALTAAERSALAQCAVFRGGFTVDAAEAVIDLSGAPDAPPHLDIIQALREKSLLVSYVDPSSRTSRLGLYEIIRAYASRKLSAAAFARAAASHARHHVLEAERQAARVDLDGGNDALEWLARETENLLAVVHRNEVEPSLRVRAALALDALFEVRGPSLTRLSLLRAVAPAVEEDGDAERTVRHLRAQGDAHRQRGHLADARIDLDRAIAAARAAGCGALERRALVTMALLDYDLSRFDLIKERYEELYDLALRAGDDEARRIAICSPVGIARTDPEDPETAALGIRNLRIRAQTLLHLCGQHIFLLGDVEAGLRFSWRALELARRIGDRLFEHVVLGSIGGLELSLGRFEAASEHLALAVQSHRETGSRHQLADALVLLGGVESAMGRFDEARALLDEGLPILAELGEEGWGRACGLGQRGVLHAMLGLFAQAEACVRLARRVVATAQPGAHAFVDLCADLLAIARARHAGQPASQTVCAYLQRLEDARKNPATRIGASLIEPLGERVLALLPGGVEDHGHAASEPPPEPTPPADLEVGPDATWFRVHPSAPVKLQRRRPLRRLLARLLEAHRDAPDKPAPPMVLVEAAWPGERMLPDAALNRLRNAVAVLRGMGLKGMLLTRDDGYLLRPSLSVSASPHLLLDDG